MKRKAALVLKPTLTIKQNGNNLTISENFVRTAMSNEFTVGVECELTVRPNGQKGKVSTAILNEKGEIKTFFTTMVALSAVQSSTWALIHNAILFLDTSTIL